MAFNRNILLIACLAGLPGCLSPLALDSMSQAYNEATANDISKQLLLNIARAKHNEPILFSGISNIAATLNFQANVGVVAASTGNNGSLLMPLIGAEASENPTISIVPMQGEEFTKRMLTPITEEKIALLLRQNVDVDQLLRLAVLELRLQDKGGEEVYHNRPRNRDDYKLFRQMVLHLSSIQHKDALYFEPLTYEQHWSLPVNSMTPAGFQALEKDFSVSLDKQHDVYRLHKRTVGRIVVSNYDPALLPEAERQRLNDETEFNLPNDLLVDIRPGYPGGEFPIHGIIRLRSFSNMLYFIGRTLSTEPESDVRKDPRTQDITENPAFTLAITETANAPENADLAVKYQGAYYAVKTDQDSEWNKSSFRVLWQIFQMTMAELPRGAVPSITISK